MTAATQGAVVEPKVKRKLRRRPPASIRNGRALMLSVAGYVFAGLFVLGLGVLVGARGEVGILLPAAAVVFPIGLISIVTARLTKSRQKWSLALVIGWAVVIAVVVGYLIATMASRQTDANGKVDANATFFAQLLLSPLFILPVASVWHFVRGARWFNGEWEHPLKAEESGARPISAPLVAS